MCIRDSAAAGDGGAGAAGGAPARAHSYYALCLLAAADGRFQCAGTALIAAIAVNSSEQLEAMLPDRTLVLGIYAVPEAARVLVAPAAHPGAAVRVLAKTALFGGDVARDVEEGAPLPEGVLVAWAAAPPAPPEAPAAAAACASLSLIHI